MEKKENNHTSQSAHRLIQDVGRAKSGRVRPIKVRDGATIGELDDAWRRQGNWLRNRLRPVQEPAATETSLRHSYRSQLRVAPLALLDAPTYAGAGRVSTDILARFKQSAVAPLAAASSLYATTFLPWLQRKLPSSYSLSGGLKVDWRTSTIYGFKRYGLPLITATAVLLVLAINLPDGRKTAPNTDGTPQQPAGGISNGSNASTAYHNSGSNAHSANKNVAGSNSTTTNGNSAENPVYNPPASASSGANNGSGSATSYTPPTYTYGRGGGEAQPVPTSTTTSPSQPTSSSSSSPLPSGIPGVTTPVPITVPGQSTDLQGKPVVGTSPTTVTLN